MNCVRMRSRLYKIKVKCIVWRGFKPAPLSLFCRVGSSLYILSVGLITF